MTRYAADTSVPVERSRSEIEGTLQRFGAEKFMSGWDQEKAVIAFVFKGRAIRFQLKLPDKSKFSRTPARGHPRSPDEIQRAWEQACRESWRVLALMIKAKLVAVTRGDVSFEDEFLAYTVLPSGGTVSEWLQPQIGEALRTGQMPQTLPLLPG